MVTDDSKSAPSDRTARPERAGMLAGPWQPLTWGGVAAFAPAGLRRLLVVQSIVALLATGAVLWFLDAGWFPAVRDAIRALPETGLIERQELLSPRVTAAPLAENRLLTIIVTAGEEPSPSLASDLRVEFRRRTLSVCSVFGCVTMPYPKDWVFALNRPEIQAWWGAWKPVLYVVAAVSTFGGLFVSWLFLATLYAPFVRTYSFFKDRAVTWAGSWRLSAAALLPGALLAGAALVLYAAAVIDLFRFLLLWLLHFLVPWAYLVCSPRRLPAVANRPGGAARNPFGNGGGRKRSANPFGSKDGSTDGADGRRCWHAGGAKPK